MLFGQDEHPVASEHPLIFRVIVDPVSPETVVGSSPGSTVVDLREAGRGVAESA